MKNVVCFGEIMLRLNPKGYLKLTQANEFLATYAGSEANVAVSLANYGCKAIFVSKVPDNDIGQNAINELRRYGVNTSKVLRGGERLGIYFLEKGASQRPSKVIYDRKFSSLAQSNVEEYIWDDILKGVEWFHFSGITPALSQNMFNVCLEACKYAKKNKIMVSCDLNFRKNLWKSDKANECMSQLMEYTDVVIANEEDVKDVFGIEAENTNVIEGKLDLDSYYDISKKLINKFNLKFVATTLRQSISANENNWSAILHDGKQGYVADTYSMKIVDRVGGGDSFAAALIYSLVNDYSNQKSIDFATAASCLKHSIENDFNLIKKEDVEGLLKGNGSGRIQR